jgi:hypothetical protein
MNVACNYFAEKGEGRATTPPKKMFCFAEHGARWAWIQPPAWIKLKIHIGQGSRTCTTKLAAGDASAPIDLFALGVQLSTPIVLSGRLC